MSPDTSDRVLMILCGIMLFFAICMLVSTGVVIGAAVSLIFD